MKDLVNYNAVLGIYPEREMKRLKASASDFEWRGTKDRKKKDQ